MKDISSFPDVTNVNFRDSKFFTALKNNDKSVEGLARYENVQELLNSIKEFTELPDEDGVLEAETKGLGNYLQQIDFPRADDVNRRSG